MFSQTYLELFFHNLIKLLHQMQQTSIQERYFPNSKVQHTYEISIYNLVVWLFSIDNLQLLKDEDMSKIKKVCRKSKYFLNPLIKIAHLTKTIAYLKKFQQKNNRQYFLKLCISLSYFRQPTYQQKIFDSDIQQICVLCPQEMDANKLAELTNFFKGKKNVYFCSSIKQIIEMASKEVQHFTKASRTFHNSQPLVQENVQKTNKCRYRICACINMKASDQNKRANQMKEFAEHEYTKYKRYILDLVESNRKQERYWKVTLFDDIFKDYLQTVAEYRRLLVDKASDEEKEVARIALWIQMVRIYKQESFFYHFVNNNMRILTEKHDQWEFLAQPISYLYQSIKGLYDHHSSKDLFYQQISFVYRSGRIKQSQIQNFIKNGVKIHTIVSEEMAKANIIKQLQDLVKKQQSKTVSQAEVANLYIQFYGFLSTTTSNKKAVEVFLYNDASVNQSTQGTENLISQQYGCIFMIKICNDKYAKCPEKLKYGYFKYGCFKFTAEVERLLRKSSNRIENYLDKNDNEEEILFNLLNTFKVLGITRMQGPEKAVYIIQLQFGPFEEMLFEKSIDKLTKYEKQVRFNYCGVYNKIRNAESFDIADAYEAQNQLQKAEKFYEQKLFIQDSNFKSERYDPKQFELCKQDKKNYMLSLSEVYEKRGKMRQAEQSSKLVIKCYQFMQMEGEKAIYIKHLKKNQQMQKMATQQIEKSINIYERQLLLEKRRDQLKMKEQNHEKNLQKAELDLAEGLFQFQIGDLKKSLKFFSSAEKTTTEFFRNLRSIKEGCLVKDYLLYLFCCKSKIEQRTLSYCAFVEKLRPMLLKEYGVEGQRKFDSAFSSAIYLYCDAVAYLGQKIKTLKQPQKFKEILQRFNSQINLLELAKEEEKILSLNFQKEPTDQLKRIMKQISRDIFSLAKQSLNEQQLNKKGKALMSEIQNYDELKTLLLNNQQQKIQQETFKKIIEKFKNQEISRKKTLVEKMIEKTEQRATQQLMDLKRLIKQFIQQLQKQNYSQANPKVLKLRNQWAHLSNLQQTSFQQAHQQIRIVLQNGCKMEVQHLQMAKAHKIKGSLLLKQQKYSEAGGQFAKSIDYIIGNLTKRIDIRPKPEQNSHQSSSTRIRNTESSPNSSQSKYYEQTTKQDLTATKFAHVKHLWLDEVFLQAQLLMCEAHLHQTYEITLTIKQLKKLIRQKREDKKMNSAVNEWRRDLSRLRQKRKWYMEYVETMIKQQLVDIFKFRERELIGGKLEILYPKIIGLYSLNCKEIHKDNTILAFENFSNSLRRSDSLYSQNNSSTLEMCCEIIFNFSYNPFAYQKIHQLKFLERIRLSIQNNRDRQYFKWKIYKALYIIQKYGKSNKQKQTNFLRNSINHLEHLLQNKQNTFLRRQKNLLQEQLSILIGDNNQVDKPSYRRKQILQQYQSKKQKQEQEQKKQFSKIEKIVSELAQDKQQQEIMNVQVQREEVQVQREEVETNSFQRIYVKGRAKKSTFEAQASGLDWAGLKSFQEKQQKREKNQTPDQKRKKSNLRKNVQKDQQKKSKQKSELRNL